VIYANLDAFINSFVGVSVITLQRNSSDRRNGQHIYRKGQSTDSTCDNGNAVNYPKPGPDLLLSRRSRQMPGRNMQFQYWEWNLFSSRWSSRMVQAIN
jgi:hypothetical protein